VALVRTGVSEELVDSIIRVKIIRQLLVTANVFLTSLIIFVLRMEGRVPPKCWISQGPQGFTSQKTAFFIVTAVKSSNLT
jgi:hypothetical protein